MWPQLEWSTRSELLNLVNRQGDYRSTESVEVNMQRLKRG